MYFDVDIAENSGGFTRRDRVIDRNFSNWHEKITATTILPPLETERTEGGTIRKSDHNIVYMQAELPKLDPPNWQTFTYRQFSETSADAFCKWIAGVDWTEVFEASGSNAKARKFQEVLDKGMDYYFPVKTCRKKDSDLPWFNEVARKKVKKKKAVYKAENRSDRWKAIRDDLDNYLLRRQENFLKKQRDKLSKSLARAFFNNVKNYKTFERPTTFDVRSLMPGSSDQEVADEAAAYFNRISDEFEPLEPFSIPRTYERQLPMLSAAEVSGKLKACKKPASIVDGDIYPVLVSKCADYLAIPLHEIFNTITATSVWPVAWKKELVTIIPKKSIPSGFSDLRNISCTKLFSKVYEAYVLAWAMEEISLKDNQFGGVKGCSTAHMLISIWQEILDNCEDYRSATVISAIDYAKAFNRVSYQHCLKALKDKGASSSIIRLIATFLTNRTMSVKVGNTRSQPLPVNGGCPQGSILGVFLFNVTTDDLEDDFLGIARQSPAPEPSSPEPVRERDVAASSPATEQSELPDWEISPLGGGRYRVRDLEIVFESGTRNVPTIEYSDEGPVDLPVEEKVGTQVIVEKPVIIRKYVDDNVIVEKVNYGRTVMDIVNQVPIKSRLAPGSQNAFRSITKRAEEKEMKVNTLKTQLLVISDALNYTPMAYIHDRDGNKIESGTNMKVLGFHFTQKPTMHKHIESIIATIRRKYWTLRHLKKLGFSQSELVTVYRSNIRPSAEYCDVVYHSSLTDDQDERLERAQVGALRVIFDYKMSARRLREAANVETLRERRIMHCDRFAEKCAASDRFSGWFPLKEARSARGGEKYLERYARCDRLVNSPIYFMRRRLNGKEGRTYGERNREFRE